MSTRVGNESWAMNARQAAAILALQEQYPAPMVVGWRVTPWSRRFR
jgi:hypothetical protein